jgi:hypothetical protein
MTLTSNHIWNIAAATGIDVAQITKGLSANNRIDC